jgi:acylphosphatase
MAVVRRRVVVSGRVQGVFFRHTAAGAARARGVSGWVRNRPDGSVEAVFQGEPAAVDSMIQWCRTGPRGARVDSVTVQEESPQEGEPGFETEW